MTTSSLFDIPSTDKVLKKLKRTRPFRAAAACDAVISAYQEAGLCKKFGGAVPDYARK